MRVEVHGAGELAEALRALAAHAGHTVVADDADVAFVCWPAHELRARVRVWAPGPAARVVVAAPGLEPRSGARLSDVVLAESAALRVGALAGPILPSEVRRRSPCAAVVASRFDDVGRHGAAALRSPLCRVYTSHDLAGVELAAALVEVLAVALGVAHGLGLGLGAEALLVSRGIVEGSRLAAREGGDVRTFAGLAGVGDLVACAGSPDHAGHRRGLVLARGVADPELAASARALLALEKNLPITAAIAALAAGEVAAPDALHALMTREHADEWDA